MDQIDRQILMQLQHNAAQPVADIARKVGLSVTPCWRRIQLLLQGRPKQVSKVNAECFWGTSLVTKHMPAMPSGLIPSEQASIWDHSNDLRT